MSTTQPAEFVQRLNGELQTFEGCARLIVALCTASVLTAVLVNFQLARKVHVVRNERSSWIRTSSMLAFFGAFYLLIRLHVGAVVVQQIYYPAAITGLLLVLLGTAVNVIGRLALGRNWGNQVIIYQDHKLVTAGAYRFVRHPLYAGLIWMFLGASLVFQNWMALAVTMFVFIPAMYKRAKLEEKALVAQFPGYVAYRNQTGMFVPISMGSEVAQVPQPAFAFCRISLTVLLWIAWWQHSIWLVAAVLAILVLSVVLKVQRSPMIQLYQQTVLRIFPAQHYAVLDVPAMRFAHILGAIMTFAVLITILLSPSAGWWSLVVLGTIKTISAFGFCPASKLFVCMRNGGCCALTRSSQC